PGWRLYEAHHTTWSVSSIVNQWEIMKSNSAGSFFARMRQKLFNKCLNWEIFDRIFPHHQGEKNCGYPFRTRQQMNNQTNELDLESLLDTIEEHINNMPDAYGESFRYVMHRDLHARLSMYEQVARGRIRRTCDPRFVARRSEVSK